MDWAIVTGANSGMGAATALALARGGKAVVLACRDMVRGLRLVERIRQEVAGSVVEAVSLELGSFSAIDFFVERMGARRVSILVNNAGVLPEKLEVTPSGFEKCFGINYIGHWYLTQSLLKKHLVDGARIVNIASLTYKTGHLGAESFGIPSAYNRFSCYSDSKRAVVQWTLKLSEMLASRHISVNAVDPWIVNTDIIKMHNWVDPLCDIFFRPFIYSPEKAARTAIRLALSAEVAGESGKLYKDCREKHIVGGVLHNAEERNWLWKETLEVVKHRGYTV